MFKYLSFSFPVSILAVIIGESIKPSVGANIGGGILIMLGLLLTIVGLFGLVRIGESKTKRNSAIILVSLVILLPSLWYFEERQNSKLFCNEKLAKNEALLKEDVPLCKKYLPDVEFKVVQ